MCALEEIMNILQYMQKMLVDSVWTKEGVYKNHVLRNIYKCNCRPGEGGRICHIQNTNQLEVRQMKTFSGPPNSQIHPSPFPLQ